jgi:hypothetical protein
MMKKLEPPPYLLRRFTVNIFPYIHIISKKMHGANASLMGWGLPHAALNINALLYFTITLLHNY